MEHGFESFSENDCKSMDDCLRPAGLGGCGRRHAGNRSPGCALEAGAQLSAAGRYQGGTGHLVTEAGEYLVMAPAHAGKPAQVLVYSVVPAR